jgi:EAL domain-containing protein (putative c-di-GMP-specific phosphodiesterase class I)
LYQIIVTPDRKPVGVEVLAHLEGQDQTVITTNQFIEASEANGMINQIGLQIMDLGFAAASTLGPDMVVSINVSPVQLYDTEFPSRAKEILLKHKLSPH